MKELIGKTIKQILWDEEWRQIIAFITHSGDFVYSVYGDCCSYSYIHDFYGVQKLLKNGPVLEVNRIPLNEFEINGNYTQCYGYEFVTMDGEFGEVTSVFSFRNESNGYYGGGIELIGHHDLSKLVLLTKDKI